MAFTNPDKELIQTRILKLETAYNTGDIDTALSLFVDNGLDYSDYGTYLHAHPHTHSNDTNRTTKASTHST
jgi:hypothetical protein